MTPDAIANANPRFSIPARDETTHAEPAKVPTDHFQAQTVYNIPAEATNSLVDRCCGCPSL